MSEAEIKLQIIRIIDTQQGEMLSELYELIQRKLNPSNETGGEALSPLEQGYKAMSEDKEREAEAFEWIEGTLNSSEL